MFLTKQEKEAELWQKTAACGGYERGAFFLSGTFFCYFSFC
jgi:hypothetical protein